MALQTMLTIRFAVVLGAVGLLCGFVGPMVLAPGANQGPMLGLFITGPAGVLLGAVLGVAVQARRWSAATQSKVLLGSSAALAAAVLFASIPRPSYRADIVETEVRACTPPQELRASAVARLDAMEAARTDGHPGQWGERFDQALAQRPGVVLDVQVRRVRQVYEKQAAWNRGEFSAGPWTTTALSARYFASAAQLSCNAARVGDRFVLVVRGGTGYWRPQGIAEILGLRSAEPATAQYAALAARG